MEYVHKAKDMCHVATQTAVIELKDIYYVNEGCVCV